jgi:hypothetical protein
MDGGTDNQRKNKIKFHLSLEISWLYSYQKIINLIDGIS